MGFVRRGAAWASRQLVSRRGDGGVSNANRDSGGPAIGTNVSGDVVTVAVDVGHRISLGFDLVDSKGHSLGRKVGEFEELFEGSEDGQFFRSLCLERAGEGEQSDLVKDLLLEVREVSGGLEPVLDIGVQEPVLRGDKVVLAAGEWVSAAMAWLKAFAAQRLRGKEPVFLIAVAIGTREVGRLG